MPDQAAIHAARFASAVTIVVRRPDLTATMSSYLIDEIEWNPRITVRGSTRVVDGGPDDVSHLAWLHLEDVTTGEQERVEARGLFLLLGAAPECGCCPTRCCATSTASSSPVATSPASAVPTASCEPIRATPTIVVSARNRL